MRELMARTSRPLVRRAAMAGALAATAGLVACGEDLHSGPQPFSATLVLSGWSDTLVVGEQRPVAVRVLDAQGREILGSSVRWSIATPAVVGARLNAAPTAGTPAAAPSTASTVDAVSATDSLQITGQRAGTSDVVITLTDPRFVAAPLPVHAVVVVAGVRVATAHDTTITALGDTSFVRGSALGRVTGSMAVRPLAGQGVIWSRQGAGAITLVGEGDSVRAVAAALGTDTLVATHRLCLRGARCADTVVVHVAQSASPFSSGATTYRAWSLGDSVAPQVLVQDARGNAIAGVRLTVAPLTAADSAIVAVNSTVGVPSFDRVALAATPTTTPVSPTPASAPFMLRAQIAPAVGALPVASSAAQAAVPLATAPLVAQANGTARVLVRAYTADGALLAADTLRVIVRQIAQSVRVAPAEADLTPGDSIPVQIIARDARGHLIPDATFQPAMAGATLRDGRIIIPANAVAGQATLQASVTGVAQPRQNAGAPIADPAPDSARVTVRIPQPIVAGDTSANAENTLSVPIVGPDKRPLVGVWVRFLIPAGRLAADSVQTDGAGIARTRWTLPTRVGTYTASAVLLNSSTNAPGDSSGRIVIRHTTSVRAGAAATLALTTAPALTATIGGTLPTAPVVQVTDQYGNPVSIAGIAVTVVAQPSSTTLGGTLTVLTDSLGQARFADLGFTSATVPTTLAFNATTSAGPLAGTISQPITVPVAPAPPAPPAPNGQGTVVLSASSVVSGNTVTLTITPFNGTGQPLGAGHVVTASLGITAQLGSTGTLSAITDQGDGTYTATITGVRAGTALTVNATSDGIALATTPALVVTAGAPSAATSSLSLSASTVASGQTVTVSVLVQDAAGNTVTTAVPGDVALATTIGSLGTVTCSNGTCSAIYTGGVAGTATVTATIGGAAVLNSPAALGVTSSLVATQAIAARVLTAGAATGGFTPVTATGGVMPYSFALSGGSLPAGLSFSTSTGAISGTAMATAATTSLTVTVTDAATNTAAQSFTLTVNPALVATQAVASTALAVGTPYTAFTPVTVSGGTAPITLALSGGTLPAGMSFNATTGAISGTATASLGATIFTLTATDAAGATATATFGLRVDGPATAPAITSINAGDATLSIAFTAPTSDGGSAVTTYEYSTDGGSTWTTRSPAGTASPLVIAGLVNGTTYPVQLRAVTAAGSGLASGSMNGTPRTSASAPTITAITASSTQLSVAFTAPSSNGGATITTYEYSTDGGTSWTARSPAATTTPLVLTGLVNGTTYVVTLRAVNAAGSGAAAATMNGTPLGLPGAPTNLAANGGTAAVDLTWTAPSNTGGSAITDYTVQYSSNGGTSWATFAHGASAATSITVTGLSNSTTYTFRVAALTAVGTGPQSTVATATTLTPIPAGAPGAPTNLAVSFNQLTATTQNGTLSWSAPSSVGTSSITDYTIEYKLATASAWTTVTHTASTSTSIAITGFTSASDYQFRVAAKNTAGTGPTSTILAATTTGPSDRLACTTPGSSNSSANSISVAPCGGVQIGNLIVVPVSISNSSTVTATTVTGETGFTPIGATQLNGSMQTTIFSKIATAADVGRSTPYVFSWSGNVKSVITLVTYKGVNAANVGYQSATGTGTTAVSPAPTVSDASYTLAYFFTADVPLSSTSPTLGEWTVSSGIWKNTTAGSNNANAIAVLTSDVDKRAAGTTPAQSVTTTNMNSTSKWNAAVLVLRP